MHVFTWDATHGGEGWGLQWSHLWRWSEAYQIQHRQVKWAEHNIKPGVSWKDFNCLLLLASYRNLAEDIKSMKDEIAFNDIVLECGDESIACNKFLLSAR